MVGTNELSACFKTKALDHKDVRMAESKLAMGMWRKNELAGEIEMILRKKKWLPNHDSSSIS